MPEDDIIQISLGRFKVGITGMREAIEEVKVWKGRPDAEIAQALLEKLKPKNYIPVSAQEDYKKAFLREYKKALGEQVTEERQGLSVKILGPGCPNCEALEQLVMATVAELNLPAAVEHLRDRQEIMALGVFGLPALVINDEVKIAGQMPGKEVLKKWLLEGNQL